MVAALTCGALSGVDEGWRWMLGLALAPAVIQLLGFIFILPEVIWTTKMLVTRLSWLLYGGDRFIITTTFFILLVIFSALNRLYISSSTFVTNIDLTII